MDADMLSIYHQPAGTFFNESLRQQFLLLFGLGLLSLFVAVASADEKPTLLIGTQRAATTWRADSSPTG
jgi:hypothetical protein